eukprot:Lithocolla_globosa_v1_NODE_327_length_4455_cov_172.448409.p2 type:complete len:150 gc:universal NODE_327_length_4455_cov_172.448409:1759-1310(-)
MGKERWYRSSKFSIPSSTKRVKLRYLAASRAVTYLLDLIQLVNLNRRSFSSKIHVRSHFPFRLAGNALDFAYSRCHFKTVSEATPNCLATDAAITGRLFSLRMHCIFSIQVSKLDGEGADVNVVSMIFKIFVSLTSNAVKNILVASPWV